MVQACSVALNGDVASLPRMNCPGRVASANVEGEGPSSQKRWPLAGGGALALNCNTALAG